MSISKKRQPTCFFRKLREAKEIDKMQQTKESMWTTVKLSQSGNMFA